MPIAQACQAVGMDVPQGYGNRKTWCPFGHVAHPDSGAEAAFRIYEDTNSAYCFACAKAWRPVSLVAEVWDCNRQEAAEKLCKLAGIEPPSFQEKWSELHRPPPPDTEALAEALKQWCTRVRGPRWLAEQFEPRFATPLGDCLALLPLVTSEQEAADWFVGCKMVLQPILEG